MNPEAGALPKRSHDLYYLFAGMAHGSRKRFVRNLFLAILVGILVSGAFVCLLYLVYKP
jgi:hypothetical protein